MRENRAVSWFRRDEDEKPTPMSRLKEPVDRFVSELAHAVRRVGTQTPGANVDGAVDEVREEAFHLVAGFVDCDGLHTDLELQAVIDVFGEWWPSRFALMDAGKLRKAGMLNGARRRLTTPSPLLELLVSIDKQEASNLAWRYYELAMEIGHIVAALDDHTSHTELEQLARFRQMVLATLRTEGLDDEGPTTDEEAEGEEPGPRTLEEVLADLEALIGLNAVKEQVERLADMMYIEQLRAERGLAVAERSLHLVFTGNPGTGKTTVARLIAEIYLALEALPEGHLVETDRSGLVAGYVGQTAERTAEVFGEARGGVLLIDEAYALARGDEGRDFGAEATDTLVKLMEDHRHDTAVIVAGYPDEMTEFIGSNPGLQSRFPKTIHFPDYDDADLIKIFELMCEQHSYRPDKGCVEAVRSFLAAETRDKGFGNARIMRNVFEEAIARQASRLRRADGELSDQQLMRLTGNDVPGPGEL
jgi:AAA+ superfamily predicted ATPase